MFPVPPPPPPPGAPESLLARRRLAAAAAGEKPVICQKGVLISKRHEVGGDIMILPSGRKGGREEEGEAVIAAVSQWKISGLSAEIFPV